MSGRTLPEAVMMMIPEAWQNHETMPEDKRAFYEYHSCLMEPWDGPASIVFTDGKYIGAVLDRNGLRPSRYYLTHDDRVIMASEVGVLPHRSAERQGQGPPAAGPHVPRRFRAGPADSRRGAQARVRQPPAVCASGSSNQRIELNELPHRRGAARLRARHAAAADAGVRLHDRDDAVHAAAAGAASSATRSARWATTRRWPCSRDQPRMLYDYFKQLFAQVTNPPIDSIREEVIMSLECYVGPERNLLETTEEHAHRLLLPHPILSNEELAALKHIEPSRLEDRRRSTSPCRAAKARRACAGARPHLPRGRSRRSTTAIRWSFCPIAAIGRDRVPLSSLLAVGAVHHHLVRKAKRTRIGIVLEIGRSPRGASPLPAGRLRRRCDQSVPGVRVAAGKARSDDGAASPAEITPTRRSICTPIARRVAKGMLKVMAKMGISTLHRYKGAQIFEAVGLNDEVIDRCFAGTASRIQGRRASTCWPKKSLRRHALGYPDAGRAIGCPCCRTRASSTGGPTASATCGTRRRSPTCKSPPATTAPTPTGGSPITPTTMRTRNCALRGLLEIQARRQRRPIPIDEVEPAKEIVKRFCTGAMSFGSISAEAHETLAIAMNRLGGKSNTGEGGEDPERFKPLPNGDSQALGDQAGRLGPLRRHDLVPGQRRRAADQDGARRQAGRRRRTARPQGR